MGHTELCLKMFQQINGIERLLIEERVLLSVYKGYITECRKAKKSHVLLPCVVKILYSLQVTSVNTERLFSQMKSVYGDSRHRLKDEAVVSSILNNLKDDFVNGKSIEECFNELV